MIIKVMSYNNQDNANDKEIVMYFSQIGWTGEPTFAELHDILEFAEFRILWEEFCKLSP